MIDWELALAKGIEGAPAAAAILLVIWLVWSCWILLRRALQFVTGRRKGPQAVPHRQPRPVRREPTFQPSQPATESADLEELSATVDALRLRVAALEMRLGQSALAIKPTPSMPHVNSAIGETVVPLGAPKPSRRKIDLG